MRIQVIEGDVAKFSADLLVLKSANGFHGADRAIAEVLGLSQPIAFGQIRVESSLGTLRPSKVAFVGVGPLREFRYSEIRKFGKQAIDLAADQILVQNVRSLALTSHGAGTGLDEAEAFRALMAGILEGANSPRKPTALLPEDVTIVELNPRRAALFHKLIGEITHKRSTTGSVESGALDRAAVENAGEKSENRPKLFAAMPFDDQYFDEYKIAFLEAAEANGFICERLDLATYVGDVLGEIKAQISKCAGVLALMNDANANVFLEIGYAWAKEKPTLLMLKRGHKPPFDVQGHRYIEYASITELRSRLTAEIAELKKHGVLR